MLQNIKLNYKILKIYSSKADIKNVIIRQWRLNNMLKKIVTPSCNVCDSVEFILRGARKRRQLALMSANKINADAGIQAGLKAVK